LGAGSRLLNRGATRLFVSNAPLLYVDGVRADQSPNAYGLDVGGQVPSRFDDLEVADIAAVDVLRGPAATALYGADAANGVVLVTTRRGTPGPARIRGSVTQGFVATPRRFPDNLLAVTPSGGLCPLISKAAGVCGQDRILASNALESPATSPIGHGATGSYGLDVSGGTGRLRYYAAGRWEGQGGVYGLPAAEVDRLTAGANGSRPPDEVRNPNYLRRVSARTNVDLHVSPRADVSLAAGYLSSDVRMPINDNNVLGVLPSGFLGFGDSTINDGWGFFPPGDVFQIRTSQAVERLTGSLRGTWRPLSFLETSFLVGMDRVRQSDRQLQARGEGPNIAGLRLGRVLAGRANSDHYSIELGARAAFHLSPALATRTAVGLQYFNATGDTLLRLGRGGQPGRGGAGGGGAVGWPVAARRHGVRPADLRRGRAERVRSIRPRDREPRAAEQSRDRDRPDRGDLARGSALLGRMAHRLGESQPHHHARGSAAPLCADHGGPGVPGGTPGGGLLDAPDQALQRRERRRDHHAIGSGGWVVSGVPRDPVPHAGGFARYDPDLAPSGPRVGAARVPGRQQSAQLEPVPALPLR